MQYIGELKIKVQYFEKEISNCKAIKEDVDSMKEIYKMNLIGIKKELSDVVQNVSSINSMNHERLNNISAQFTNQTTFQELKIQQHSMALDQLKELMTNKKVEDGGHTLTYQNFVTKTEFEDYKSSQLQLLAEDSNIHDNDTFEEKIDKMTIMLESTPLSEYKILEIPK